jgi:outer membrane protein OmpA-like peptidoglycan-associated protein
MPGGIPALLALTVTLQAPAPLPVVPQRPGLTIVSAVAGDTLRGNRRGDYELAVALAALRPAGAELQASSFVRNDAGRYEWLRFRRTVPSSDLRSARTQVLGFDSQDVEVVPGTTSLGPSLLVMAELRQHGQVAFRVRNYASRRDNPGTLRRIGLDTFPVLLNGRRVMLPAVHLRGQLGPPGHLRPWSFWFLDDPVQPITLKVYYGPEGAPESARPEWLRQVIRIDVPDPGGGVENLALALGGVAAAPRTDASGSGGEVVVAGDTGEPTPGVGFDPAEGAGDGQDDGEAEGADGAGAGTGAGIAGAGGARSGTGTGGAGRSGTGRGSDTGLGGKGGLLRDATAACRVVVPGVYFEFDSDELNPASAPWIGLVARLLESRPDWTVTIEGHTDSIGGARYNQGLSEHRAAALKRELVARHGIDGARLGTQGFGAGRPLEPNTTLEGRARNRRVELVRPCARPGDRMRRPGS